MRNVPAVDRPAVAACRVSLQASAIRGRRRRHDGRARSTRTMSHSGRVRSRVPFRHPGRRAAGLDAARRPRTQSIPSAGAPAQRRAVGPWPR